MPRILILGGTTEGYELAQSLSDLDAVHVISSLAGRTKEPRLPVGECRMGGFGGIEGLSAYVTAHAITAIIDATHPFASRMGWNAALACAQTQIPLLRLERPAWQPVEGDHWHMANDWTQAAALAAALGPRVLLTIGRQELAHFAALNDHWFLIRSVDMPNPLPAFAQAEILLARGPFTLDGERQLLSSQRITTIVCKNSGGTATDAKLQAARQLGLDVVMLQRPQRPPTTQAATCRDAVEWVWNLGASSSDALYSGFDQPRAVSNGEDDEGSTPDQTTKGNAKGIIHR